MKVAVSSSGTDLAAQIDPRFGRCAYFIIVETDDLNFEAFNNENIALGGGAGIQSAQFVASKGARAVITGNCGPNALRTLTAAGIQVFVGQKGQVKAAVEKYKRGELSSTTEPTVSDHYGMGAAMERWEQQGQTFGKGGRIGRGMGGGKGLGRGRCMTGWSGQDQQAERGITNSQELGFLKKEADDLKKQMEDIQSRIEALEKDIEKS